MVQGASKSASHLEELSEVATEMSCGIKLFQSLYDDELSRVSQSALTAVVSKLGEISNLLHSVAVLEKYKEVK